MSNSVRIWTHPSFRNTSFKNEFIEGRITMIMQAEKKPRRIHIHIYIYMVAAFNRLRVDTRKLKGLRQCTMARAKWRVGGLQRVSLGYPPHSRIYARTYSIGDGISIRLHSARWWLSSHVCSYVCPLSPYLPLWGKCRPLGISQEHGRHQRHTLAPHRSPALYRSTLWYSDYT